MTVLPEPGTVVVVLTTAAILRSRPARAMAGYVTVSFAASMSELCGRKPAPRLRELQELSFDNVKAQIAADAAEAHNRETLAMVEAEEAKASVARQSPAEREIDGRRELHRIELETEAAQKRLEQVQDRVERAKAVIEAKGGSVYYEPAESGTGDPQHGRAIEAKIHEAVKLDINVPEVEVKIEGPAKPKPDDTAEPT